VAVMGQSGHFTARRYGESARTLEGPPAGRRPIGHLISTRRRWALSGLVAAIALGGALSADRWTAADLASRTIHGARSLMALMSQRSPGVRMADGLALTKAKAPMPPVPGANLPPPLGTSWRMVVPPPPQSVDIVTLNSPPLVPLIALSSFVTPPPLGLLPPPPGGGGFFPPPGGGPPFTPPVGGFFPPPGGGGPPPPGGGPPVGPPGPTPGPPSVPSVPEPGTWTLMLVGFGLIGWSLRKRHASFGPEVIAA